MKTIKLIAVPLLAILLVAVTSPVAKAADFYAGTTWVTYEGASYCIVVRFKAYDGSFTLEEADSLYSTIVGMVTDIQDEYGIQTWHKLPSEALAEGITGELLWDSSWTKEMGCVPCIMNRLIRCSFLAYTTVFTKGLITCVLGYTFIPESLTFRASGFHTIWL